MKVSGIGVGFIDVPQEHTQAYNTWYDHDHIPENLALPEITGARRYVATPDYKAVRRPVEMEELADGAGTYCTIYLFCEPDLAKAADILGPQIQTGPTLDDPLGDHPADTSTRAPEGGTG